MPTKAEMQELLNNCTWEWINTNGVNGYKVTGPSGASIFLPATGIRYVSWLNDAGSSGYYWSSTPYENYDIYACYLYFDSADHSMYNGYRNNGRSVRSILE
jgi:hypothetical protein